MSSFGLFRFVADPLEEGSGDSLTVIVPRGITSTHELLQVLYDRLKLPGYFGFNWNALSDCLRDLHWVSQRDVVLLHEDLPQLDDADLSVYLAVLDACIQDWKAEEDHRLIVVFPESCRTACVRKIP